MDKGVHHEECIDYDCDKLVNVYVQLWGFWLCMRPAWEIVEDIVGQAPLELETETKSSHCHITCVGLTDEMRCDGDQKAQRPRPDGGVI